MRVCMFILTVYDRSKFLIDEVSCKQERAGPSFALMTAPSFPFAVGQAATPVGMKSSAMGSAVDLV